MMLPRRARQLRWTTLSAALLVALTAAPLVAAHLGRRQTVVEHYIYKPGGPIGAMCSDGSRSFSVGRGTCSHHGGVAAWVGSEERTRTFTPTFLSRHTLAFDWIGIIVMFADFPVVGLLWLLWVDGAPRQDEWPAPGSITADVQPPPPRRHSRHRSRKKPRAKAPKTGPPPQPGLF
jgi:hypothetical protein